MIAGDMISDMDAVVKVVTEAPEQIRQLIDWGVEFDKDANGRFDLHREGDIPNSASFITKTIPAWRYKTA